MAALLAGGVMAFGAGYMMEWRVHREDAERPEELRVPPGDWRGLMVFWYFRRHGLDPLARTFLVGVLLIVAMGVLVARF